MRTVSRSEGEPQRAPANFRELPPRVVIRDGDGLFETWHGSGVPRDEPCDFCQNREGNLAIFGNWGYSYPNGNSWDDVEIVCGACQRFTYICKFTEG